jgi:hypothetical protein
MLEGDLVGDIVDTFVAITKGAPVDTQKLVSIGMRLKTVAMGLFECFKAKTKSKPIPKDKIPLPVPAPLPVPVATAMKTIHNELWVPITDAEKETQKV